MLWIVWIVLFVIVRIDDVLPILFNRHQADPPLLIPIQLASIFLFQSVRILKILPSCNKHCYLLVIVEHALQCDAMQADALWIAKGAKPRADVMAVVPERV